MINKLSKVKSTRVFLFHTFNYRGIPFVTRISCVEALLLIRKYLFGWERKIHRRLRFPSVFLRRELPQFLRNPISTFYGSLDQAREDPCYCTNRFEEHFPILARLRVYVAALASYDEFREQSFHAVFQIPIFSTHTVKCEISERENES